MMVEHEDDDHGRTFIERVFSNPGAIATILIAIVGQALFSIVFQVINNEQQEARITANTTALTEFKSAVNNLQTPLSNHVFKLEDGILDVRRSIDDISKRLDLVDTAGTRALALVSANQQRVMSQVDRLGDRIIMQDRKMTEIEAKQASPQIQIQLDALKEQQLRIIQALDANYNLLNEHLRAPDREQQNKPTRR